MSMDVLSSTTIFFNVLASKLTGFIKNINILTPLLYYPPIVVILNVIIF